MKKIQGILAVVLLLGILSGCGPKDTTLTIDNNGQPETIHIGGSVLVQLPANPSAGFTWEASQLDANLLKQVGQTEYQSASSNPAPGQGGTQILRFQAIAAGSTTLTLVYHQPFDKSTPPAQTYSIPLSIAP